MSDERARSYQREEGERVGTPTPADLLSSPEIRERFEETTAALEAADLVRRMRKQALSATGVRGISQNELAQRTGLSQPRISQIEKASGRDGVSYAVLRKIAHACGLEWTQLVRDIIMQRDVTPQPDANLEAAAPSPHSTAVPSLAAEAALYRGSIVRVENTEITLRVISVLFDEAGRPVALQTKSEQLPGVPIPLLQIGEGGMMGGIMSVQWDKTTKNFFIPEPWSTMFAAGMLQAQESWEQMRAKVEASQRQKDRWVTAS